MARGHRQWPSNRRNVSDGDSWGTISKTSSCYCEELLMGGGGGGGRESELEFALSNCSLNIYYSFHEFELGFTVSNCLLTATC